MLKLLSNYTNEKPTLPQSDNYSNDAEVKSSSSFAVGIDLGTTFSCVAVYKNGISQVIGNTLGHHLTPSVVLYDPNNSDVAVGKYAVEWGIQAKTNSIYDIKRLMGRKYDDIYVQNLINNGDYNYKIVRGMDDNAVIEVMHNKELVNKSPEEVSSEILKYLKNSASKFLGFEVKEAVISVPAHFSNAQRKATKRAAELAGLTILKLVCEPVAAAIHYSMDKLITKTNLLVFDFGGGTLDVSVIDVDKEKFRVKGVEGDSFLGGRDFDQKLSECFFSDAKSKISNENDRKINEHLLRVKKTCTKLKISLSIKQEVTIRLDHFGSTNDEFSLTVSKNEFEEICKDLFDRAIDIVTQCLNDLDISKNNIDEVLLVGGTTRIPKINEMLTEYFNGKIPKTDLNPDEAVALGAAIQAAVLKNNCIELEKFKITDVTPLSLGFELDGGLMKFAIKKNTSLPAKSNIIKTVTSQNNQKSCTMSIYEGERKNCKFNVLLTTLRINNLPLGKVGDVKFRTTFSLNEDGILDIETSEVSTNRKSKIVVTTQEYRLSQNKIKSTLDDAKKYKNEDDIFEKLINYRNKIRTYCFCVLYDLDKIINSEQKSKVKENCNEILNFTDNIENKKIDDLREKFDAMVPKIDPIIKNIITVNFHSC